MLNLSNFCLGQRSALEIASTVRTSTAQNVNCLSTQTPRKTNFYQRGIIKTKRLYFTCKLLCLLLLLASLKWATSGTFKQEHLKNQNKSVLTPYKTGKLVPLVAFVQLHLYENQICIFFSLMYFQHTLNNHTITIY